ncbi:MAG TPA: SNF2 helicase associated domain-containing protein, partial [Bacillota bacterium]|nr:SNF2 helicase associated domain-containing protein [Bacillota bacterium]
MIALTKDKIRKLASNVKTYLRGVEYFHEGMVRCLEFDSHNAVVRAEVNGNRCYNVAVNFNSGDDPDMSCDCPAFEIYQGACKHIVAALLKLAEELPSNSEIGLAGPNRSTEKPGQRPLRYDPRLAVSHTMVHALAEVNPTQENKRAVNLRATLNIELNANGKTSVELEIGETRLYIIQRIGEFLDAIRFGRELYFGKTFTFKPQEHRFRPGDQRFIDWLLPIYLDESGPFYASKYAKRSFTIPHSRLRRFFEVVRGMEDAVWKHQGVSHRFQIRDGLPPTMLTLHRRRGEIELALQKESDMYPVTPLQDVILMNDTFYLPNPQEQRAFTPILKAFGRVQDQLLPISQTDAALFIAEAVPILEGVCPVEIEPEILDALHQEPLAVSVWLDKYERGIMARVEFAYGELIINPRVPKDPADCFMVRETAKEERCLEILSEAGFNPEGEYFLLLDEEKIFRFLQDQLSAMTEVATVYYSEAFRNLQIRRPPRLSGGIRLNEQTDLLEVDFKLEEFEAGELTALLQALREKKRYFRLKDQSFISLEQPESLAIGKFLAELGVMEKGVSDRPLILPKYKALYLHEVTHAMGDERFQLNEPLKRLVHDIEEPKNLDRPVPSTLAGVLRDYQKVGFKWLKALSEYGFGGILADDMGLGKTLQVITLVAADWQERHLPSLVVAPTSLLYNWQEEIENFAPNLPTMVVDGPKSIRRHLWEKTRGVAFVITSYPLLRRDIEEVKQPSFAYCFIDEAQHIKNPETIN